MLKILSLSQGLKFERYYNKVLRYCIQGSCQSGDKSTKSEFMWYFFMLSHLLEIACVLVFRKSRTQKISH